jgi:hypothetical protein
MPISRLKTTVVLAALKLSFLTLPTALALDKEAQAAKDKGTRLFRVDQDAALLGINPVRRKPNLARCIRR